jgi:hypothetical protein
MTVPSQLAELAKLYQQRNDQYGDTYKRVGNVLWEIFDGKINLETADDINRFVTFTMVIMKMCRYAQSFDNGGHADSLDDAAVYAQMLREIDGDEHGE